MSTVNIEHLSKLDYKTFKGLVQSVAHHLDLAKQPTEDTSDLQLLSIEQVAQRLNIGRWSVYQLINKQLLKTVKIGNRRLVSSRTLEGFINRLEDGSISP